VDARAADRGCDTGREVAIADQADARAGGSNAIDEILMARAV